MRNRFQTNRTLVSLGFTPTQSNFKNKQSPSEVAAILQVTPRVHMTEKCVYGEFTINQRPIGIVTAKGLVL